MFESDSSGASALEGSSALAPIPQPAKKEPYVVLDEIAECLGSKTVGTRAANTSFREKNIIFLFLLSLNVFQTHALTSAQRNAIPSW